MSDTYTGTGRPPASCPATFKTVTLHPCRVTHDHAQGWECVNAGDGWRAVRTLVHVCNDHEDDREDGLVHGFTALLGMYGDPGNVRWEPTTHGNDEGIGGTVCHRCDGRGDTSSFNGRRPICTTCEGTGRLNVNKDTQPVSDDRSDKPTNMRGETP